MSVLNTRQTSVTQYLLDSLFTIYYKARYTITILCNYFTLIDFVHTYRIVDFHMFVIVTRHEGVQS